MLYQLLDLNRKQYHQFVKYLFWMDTKVQLIVHDIAELLSSDLHSATGLLYFSVSINSRYYKWIYFGGNGREHMHI